MIPGQLLAFRVYPAWPSRIYYTVRVFRSLRTMTDYLRSAGHRPPRDVRAMCCRPRDAGAKLGEIVFAQQWLLLSIITHEAVHAAVGWACRTRPRFVDPFLEEQFATVVGHLTRDITRRIYDHGLGM